MLYEGFEVHKTHSNRHPFGGSGMASLKKIPAAAGPTSLLAGFHSTRPERGIPECS